MFCTSNFLPIWLPYVKRSPDIQYRSQIRQPEVWTYTKPAWWQSITCCCRYKLLPLSLCVPNRRPCAEQVDPKVSMRCRVKMRQIELPDNKTWMTSSGGASWALLEYQLPTNLPAWSGKMANGPTEVLSNGKAENHCFGMYNFSQHVDTQSLCWHGVGSRIRSWVKVDKNASNFISQPTVVDNVGTFSTARRLLEFLSELGNKRSMFYRWTANVAISVTTSSVSMQRINSVLLHDTFVIDDV